MTQFCEEIRAIPTRGRLTPFHQQSHGYSYYQASPQSSPPSSMRTPTSGKMVITSNEYEDDRTSVISAAKALLSLTPSSSENENVTLSFPPPPPPHLPMVPYMPMEANAARWIPPSPHQHHGGYSYLTGTGSEASSCWLPFPQRTSYSTSTVLKTLPPAPQFHARMLQPRSNPISRQPISIEMHPSAIMVMNSSSSCQESVASSCDESSSLDDMSRHSPTAMSEGFSFSKSLSSSLTSTSTPCRPSTALPVASYYSGTISLATNRDSESLSPLHCFMRRYCVEAFSATEEEISSPRYGKSHSGRVVLGQVGIRCIHCKHRSSKNRQERAVCFPSSLKNIYHSIETWQRRHSLVCKDIPPWIKNSMTELIHNSRTGAGGRRQYWEESAQQLGMATTNHGIRFIRPPGELNPDNNTDWDNDGESTSSSDYARPSISVVSVQDKELVTDYLFTLLEQMEACRFTEQDRSSGRSKVKNCPAGFPGMQCKHCGGKAGFGRYFPANVMALSSANSDRNIYNHVIKCRRCPKHVRADLERLQLEQVQYKNRRGSRKQFFQRVWDRLHDYDDGYTTRHHHHNDTSACSTTSSTTTFINISNIGNTASV